MRKTDASGSQAWRVQRVGELWNGNAETNPVAPVEREKYAVASFGGLGSSRFFFDRPSRNFSIAHSNSLVPSSLAAVVSSPRALEKSS